MKWSWGFIFFQFVYIVGYVFRFSSIKPPLHSWDGSYLIMVDDVFDVLLSSVCIYFIEYFCINVHKGGWSEIFLWQVFV